jgi:hypothetical protein
MRFLIFCAAVAIPSFTWTQGLGSGLVIKKNVAAIGNGLAILAVVVPATQTKLPPGVGEADPFEFVEGVVRDFNRNGVADSEQRYSFAVRQAIFVLLPPTENANPHVLGRSSQISVSHRIIVEFQDEFGCIYGRPEDMLHDADGKLIIDLLAGQCRADR